MKISDLRKRAKYYRPVVETERIFPRSLRVLAFKGLTFVFIITLAVYVIFYFGSIGFVYGMLLVLFSVWALLLAWEMFCNSLMARDPHVSGVTASVAKLVLSGKTKKDVTRSLLKSKVGKEIIERFGLAKNDIKKFISTPDREKFTEKSIKTQNTVFVDLSLYVKAIIDHDLAFKEFLFKNAVQESQIVDLCQWIERRFYLELARRRWWTRDALLRIPSIGTTLSFGRAYVLEQFSLKVESPTSDALFDYFEDELDMLEDILTRNKEANALVIGSRENRHLIGLLQKKIQRGNVHPQIEHKNLFVLHTEELISNSQDKNSFERTFIKILNEIGRAGNIILVIEDLSGFIVSAQSLGAGVIPILEPYLTSTTVQVVAFSEVRTYHNVLEPNETVRESFETILVSDKEKEIIRVIVENYIARIEKNYKVKFQYKAVDAIITGVERYFVKDSPIDEVTDILADLSGKIASFGKKSITEEDVLKLFEDKTGIPMQVAEGVEKEKLLNLEEFLHRRVVGQEKAISSISDALRRVRSGISNPDRPMGTFLFLGPTGVGKTETTKALAQNFFGDEDNIVRLDMSEFSSDGSLEKLTGSFETGETGILTSMLREHPYGVLLLDEFEKASTEVHDLFLQILDEGIFSDMRGEKVNARNVIIIATSNAGSELIWKYSKNGQDVSKYEREIIDAIIEKGIFKPELVNRFDGVVVFHPLEEKHVIKITDLMISKLSDRLKEKGVDVKLSPEATQYIASVGSSSSFGARELNRVLQDKVESAIARMMLEGKVQRGDTVTLTRNDLE